MVIKNIFFKILFFFTIFFVFLFPCNSENIEGGNIIIVRNPEERDNFDEDYLFSKLIINLNINIVPYKFPKILIKTEENFFPQTIFIVSTINDLRQLQEIYFYLPFLDIFSSDYFDNNHLVLIITDKIGSQDLRNERIEQNDQNYSFYVERWYLGREHITYLSLKSMFYFLEIPK
jgi:hypothetical protein